MIILPHTDALLREAGNDFAADDLQLAASRTFRGTAHETETVPVSVIETFWKRFVEAHRILFRSGDEMQEAA